MIPDDLSYTAEHEWIRGDLTAGSSVRVGITDYAQGELGDIVYVDLPESGTPVTAGEPMGELESTKSVSDLFSPVNGSVAAVNAALVETPELVNSDPYGEGWLVEITVGDDPGAASLLSAADYESAIEAG